MSRPRPVFNPELKLDARGNIASDEFLRDKNGDLVPALPSRFTAETLAAKKRVVGNIIWAAQWILNPEDDDEAVFPRKRAQIVPRQQCPPLDTMTIVMTVDPAISQEKWADFTALAVVGFDTMNRMWVLDLRRGRWTESQTVDNVYAAWRKTGGIQSIGFEAIGFAKLYRREFTRAGEIRGYLPIHTLERDTKKHKNTRILSLEPLWSAGELFLLDDLEALDDFLDEAARFRRYRESEHDDMLDTLADALQTRTQPSEKPKEYLIDDPVVIERMEFEDRVKAQRPDLDRASIRNAWMMAKRREIFDEQREQAVSSGGNEFW